MITVILVELNGFFLKAFLWCTSLLFKVQTKLLLKANIYQNEDFIRFNINGVILTKESKTKINSRQPLNNYTNQSVDLTVYEDGSSLVSLVIPTNETHAYKIQSQMRSYFKNSKFLKEMYSEK